MWKAIVLKELRGVMPIACLAAIAYLACVANMIGYPVFFGIMEINTNDIIPFFNDSFVNDIMCLGMVFAVALGFWQTVSENHRGTWLFLLHRPMSARKIIGAKLVVGAVVYLVVTAIAILIYAAWAAKPGHHASSFGWWMTKETWYYAFLMLLGYFGAFLSGIRPGRWFGTRLLPLIAAGIVGMIIAQESTLQYWVWGMFFTVLAIIFSVIVIFHVSRTRDFS
jgi:ABC-type transport system involved in multi-copper enzyme maturation permease subunit